MAGNNLHGLSEKIDINHFHLFCGLGGGAKGFNSRASPCRHAGSKIPLPRWH